MLSAGTEKVALTSFARVLERDDVRHSLRGLRVEIDNRQPFRDEAKQIFDAIGKLSLTSLLISTLDLAKTVCCQF